MKLAKILSPALLLAQIGSAQDTDEAFNFGTNDDVCLKLDAEHVVVYDENWQYAGGEWIDDGQILKQSWEPGMGIRAVNYCIDESAKTFLSMQLLVGNEGDPLEKWVPLRKHGQSGGTCKRWRLKEEDYIRIVQYTWNRYTETVVQVAFKTHND